MFTGLCVSSFVPGSAFQDCSSVMLFGLWVSSFVPGLGFQYCASAGLQGLQTLSVSPNCNNATRMLWNPRPS